MRIGAAGEAAPSFATLLCYVRCGRTPLECAPLVGIRACPRVHVVQCGAISEPTWARSAPGAQHRTRRSVAGLCGEGIKANFRGG